ncbi:MAG TPA: hypothetical protein VER32_11015 [Pyrinomonadaceae bacterium]|nr:hypothetical protein [Pyrinomonadaceae bacterium]
MKTKTPIKIIKRGERNRPVVEPAEKKSAKEAARDMVATVSDWVSEFQQKRRTETRQAIKSLFTETTPQTS